MKTDFDYENEILDSEAEFENDIYLDEENEEEFDEEKYSEGDIITEKEVVDGEIITKTYELVYDYENDCLRKELINKEKAKRETKNDWKKYGLDKKYEGEFSLEKAYTLYFDMDDNGNLKESSQKEAICYAAYFARCGNDDAKNFIICDVINKEETAASIAIREFACNAFYLFFRNYVRQVTEKHYNVLPRKVSYDRVVEGENYLWLYIIETLSKFNPSISKINTYYSFNALNNELQNFDISFTGQAVSKPTWIFFSKVGTVINDIENNKQVPTIDAVTMLYNEKFNDTKKPEAIKNAIDFLSMQNTMVKADSEEGVGLMNAQAQSAFAEPEKAYIKKEKDVVISTIINSLTDLQKNILSFKFGMGITDDGSIYDTGIVLTTKDLSRKLGVSEEKIEQEYKIAENVFRNTYPKEGKIDKHLSGRTPIFTDMTDNFDLKAFLSMTDEIEFEDIDGGFTKID